MVESSQDIYPSQIPDFDMQPVPVAFQYFQAVDTITNGINPDDRGYLNILVYAPDEHQPRLSILRHIAKYIDGPFGIQDEIGLKTSKNRWQLNAERSPEGMYSRYAQTLSEDCATFMDEFVKAFHDIVQVDGATMYINNTKTFRSLHGAWVPYTPGDSIPTTEKTLSPSSDQDILLDTN